MGKKAKIIGGSICGVVCVGILAGAAVIFAWPRDGAISLVRPPVVKVTPAGLLTSHHKDLIKAFGKAAGSKKRNIEEEEEEELMFMERQNPKNFTGNVTTEEIIDRFYSDGPTDLMGILGSIDKRIDGWNTGEAIKHQNCRDVEPVPYKVHQWNAEVQKELRFYAQCYQDFGDGGFAMYGLKDGVRYIYDYSPPKVGDNAMASWITAEGKVEGWYAVNSQTGGSRVVSHFVADEESGAFEMVAGGDNCGFCGVHLLSNGTQMLVEGSPGSAISCIETSSICVDTTDDAMPPVPDGCVGFNYTLIPIGMSSPLQSFYPGALNGNDIKVDTNDKDLSQMLGPTSVPAGVQSF